MFFQLHPTEIVTTKEQQAIKAGSRKYYLFAVTLPSASSESGHFYH